MQKSQQMKNGYNDQEREKTIAGPMKMTLTHSRAFFNPNYFLISATLRILIQIEAILPILIHLSQDWGCKWGMTQADD